MSFSTHNPRRLSLLDRSKPLAVALIALLSGLALTAYIADVEADLDLLIDRAIAAIVDGEPTEETGTVTSRTVDPRSGKTVVLTYRRPA